MLISVIQFHIFIAIISFLFLCLFLK